MAIGQEDDLCIEVPTQCNCSVGRKRERLVSMGTFKGSSVHNINFYIKLQYLQSEVLLFS